MFFKEATWLLMCSWTNAMERYVQKHGAGLIIYTQSIVIEISANVQGLKPKSDMKFD